MPIIIDPDSISRSGQIGEPGETNHTNVTLRVRWEPGEGEDADDYPGDHALVISAFVPRERYTDALDEPSWLTNLICRRITYRTLPGPALFTLEVTAYYDTLVPATSWGEFVRVTKVPGSRSMALYRSGWDWEDIEETGTEPFPATEDMGGDKVDIHGVPRMIGVPQSTVTVEVLWNRTRNTPPEPPESWLDTYANTRNSVEFLGYAPGTLLYKGYGQSPSSNEVVVVSHTFVYDTFLHLKQTPVANAQGQPSLGPGVTIIDRPQKQVDKVVWEQPFPDKTDFTAMFSAEMLAELATVKPEWPT